MPEGCALEKKSWAPAAAMGEERKTPWAGSVELPWGRRDKEEGSGG
jgi:hypothetical protein